jgi:phosphoglycolate phosphatase
VTPDPQGPVVGFDLDLTLVDSRPGIAASLDALAAETGRPVDSGDIVARLGPPITAELARWFTPDEVPQALATFRGFMAEFGAAQSLPLPGAVESLQAVRSAGGRSIVVTAKHEPLARQTLHACGLSVDVVVGDAWAEQKGAALSEAGASVYVGDNPSDVLGARVAGATAVLVRTSVAIGALTEEQLVAAGADVLLDDLHEFPRWWAGT